MRGGWFSFGLVLSTIAALTVLVSTAEAVEKRADAITINNKPDAKFEPWRTGTVYGIRPLISRDESDKTNTASNLASTKKASMAISREVFIKAAKEIPEVYMLMGAYAVDENTITMYELAHIINASKFRKAYTPDWKNDSRKPALERKSVHVKDGYEIVYASKIKPVNPVLDAFSGNAVGVTALLAEGVIDTANAKLIKLGSKNEYYYPIKPEYAGTLSNIITGTDIAETLRSDLLMRQIQRLISTTKKYGPVEKSMLIQMGRITFGRPTIYYPDELNLTIPRDIGRDFDVLWVDLAVSFRDMKAYNISEMAYNLFVPEGYLALNLIPLRSSVKVTKETELKTPSVTVKGPSGEISLGEFYRRKVNIDYLKPVLISEGQGEAAFSWKLSEEAVSSGTHQFAAIIGVPKGAKNFSIAMSAHVRFEEYYVMNKLAGTEIFWYARQLQ